MTRTAIKGALAAMLLTTMGVGQARAEPEPLSAYMALPQQPPSARIAYGPGASQMVELFRPKGKGPFPVVVLIHGGCWLRAFEGLKQTSGIAADLASHGIAVWNVEYRGVDEPGGGYPGTFQDIAQAVDRLVADAGKYGLDTRRVVALGHSAGAHLGLWAAARPRLPASSLLRGGRPLAIPTVISLGGVGDLRAQEAVAREVCSFDRDKLLGVRPNPFADTSPAELLPAGTRVVMVHGVFDHVFPPYTGRAYAEKARKAGDLAEAVIIPDAGHFDPVMATTPAWTVVRGLVQRELKRLGGSSHAR